VTLIRGSRAERKRERRGYDFTTQPWCIVKAWQFSERCEVPLRWNDDCVWAKCKGF